MRDLCGVCVYFGYDYDSTVAVHAAVQFLERYEGVDHDDAWYLMTFAHGFLDSMLLLGRDLTDAPYEMQMLVFEQLVNGVSYAQAVRAARLLLEV